MIDRSLSRSTPTDQLTIRALTLSDRPTWDALTQMGAGGCFMQSWAWADFKELEGYQTFRYGIFAQETLVGGCIFHIYLRENSTNLVFAPGGPILLPEFAVAGMPLLIAQAKQLAQKSGAIAFRIEPLLSEKPDELNGFVRAPVDLLPCETLLIDLQPSEAEILAAMKPKGRYNIRLSQRHGVETRFMADSQAIPTFYDLFWETVDRQQFFGEPYGFFINLCQTLFAANMAEIGFATWQGQLLAAILVVYWGDRATYLYGGRSTEQSHRMAGYGLHWSAMQRSKARGCTLYDFYGYTDDPKHGYAKFSQFKRQFGGTPVKLIGAHDYLFYDQLADTLINLFKQLHVSPE